MQLFKHQQKLLDENPSKHLLAWGTGSGKTRTAIELACKKEQPCLIICPKSLTLNWRNEIDKWSTKNMFFDVWSKEQFKKHKPILPKGGTLIIDEFHYLSNYKSQLFKTVLERIEIDKPAYIFGLTATPYLSTPFNLYSLAKILGHEWNWYKFKKHFFYDIRMGHKTIPVIRKNIEGEIGGLVGKLGSTVRLEDCFDVPEQIFQTEYFQLTKEQKSAIDQLDDILPIVRFTKIHQICGGSLKGDRYTSDKYYKSEKLDRLLELIAEHPLMAVVCRYNAEIHYLHDQIKQTYPGRRLFSITGSTPDRQSVVDAVNQSNEGILLINGACSEGYGIGNIPIMVFYSYDFSLKNYIQMLGRIQRADNIKKNVYLSLIVKDSIDEDIYKKVVEEKQDFHLEIYNQ